VPSPLDACAASAQMEEIATELIGKIKAAAASGVPPALTQPAAQGPGSRKATEHAQPLSTEEPKQVVAIGVSTGGPNAVQYLLSQLPADFPAAILIVQHMPEGFTEAFARRLDECCAIRVKEAQTGDLVVAGRALICPGNRHMKACRTALGKSVLLTDEERVNGHRPSVDVLFRSVAQVFGEHALGVIMTGMGDDGADALGEIKRAGGITLAQSEESCVVFGMPKAAIERGNVKRILPLEAMANTLQVHCHA
jgi:two-component system chemotaxis response regulator CheB